MCARNVSRRPRPKTGYSRKLAFAIAVVVLAPWLLYLTFVPFSLLALGFGLAAAAMTLAVLAFVILMLRPVAAIAGALRQNARAAGETIMSADDIDAILEGVARLDAKVAAMHHRWMQRQPVTGLPTRESILREITADIQQNALPTLLGTIRFADYDRLAAFDPPTADQALKSFSERLAGATGKSRPLAHIDRDCFAIWFRAATPENAAIELQAICYALGQEISAADIRIIPEIEVGAAIYPEGGSDAPALITRSLGMLAKTDASGKVDLFPPRSAHASRERYSLEQDLRQAISHQQLELHFQPAVDLSRGVVIGAEALLRWQHPKAGMISPALFVPILEDANLAGEIGMWTLNAACREARDWQRRGIDGLKVAVNLSATQLRDPNLKLMIQRTLERHQLRPEALELELTETAATEDADRTFRLFGELRALGISLAIDDFGSGYSSLSYLKNLPFDKLKIDREFVTRVHERPDSQAICRCLVELTRGLGISVLVEGTETLEEVEFLRGIGCEIFQGFYFSKPLASEDFIRCAMDPAWLQSFGTPVAPTQRIMEHRTTA